MNWTIIGRQMGLNDWRVRGIVGFLCSGPHLFDPPYLDSG
jgi:hypothetical protein